ncbi:uncharacterized protein LOC111788778 isoform X2 [Cucurbita pepo subsp. pepo]|uniref:uncharacterized protein LOC111788778 isoform X2 n=1 Tax=Cucurbita pepo subsp. pepo TaxID=3664 RepID=UPI000C9D87F2|nr:uncharacterized protein LOC111788778 isoform X2 [Cucurbita pepo subsp. pepo]
MKQLESDPLDFESDPLDFESDPLDFEYDPLVYKTAFESNGLCTVRLSLIGAVVLLTNLTFMGFSRYFLNQEEEHCFEALILCSIITPRVASFCS